MRRPGFFAVAALVDTCSWWTFESSTSTKLTPAFGLTGNETEAPKSSVPLGPGGNETVGCRCRTLPTKKEEARAWPRWRCGGSCLSVAHCLLGTRSICQRIEALNL
jgi:hypothetical protein